MIMEKIDQGKTDQEIIKEFLGSTGGGRPNIPKEIKTKGKVTDKDIKNAEPMKDLMSEGDYQKKLGFVFLL
jgi:hypothetical protein